MMACRHGRLISKQLGLKKRFSWMYMGCCTLCLSARCNNLFSIVLYLRAFSQYLTSCVLSTLICSNKDVWFVSYTCQDIPSTSGSHWITWCENIIPDGCSQQYKVYTNCQLSDKYYLKNNNKNFPFSIGLIYTCNMKEEVLILVDLNKRGQEEGKSVGFVTWPGVILSPTLTNANIHWKGAQRFFS